MSTNTPTDARAAEIRKILESKTFRNTEVLKRLLEYLAGQSGELKEYTVGVEAFGKPPEYDPRSDSSVRVQAGKLRQKLDEYYRTEAAPGEPVITLPKGHFRLEVVEIAPVADAAVSRPQWLWAAVGIAVLVLGLASWLIVRSRPASVALAGAAWNSEMEELWRPFVASPKPLLVVIGTPLFSKVGNDFFRDPALNTPDAVAGSDRLQAIEKALGEKSAAEAFPYTGVGEATGAFALARLLLPRGKDLSLQQSHLLTWEDISRNNVVFLGPPKYNLQTMDLPVVQDFEISHSRVQNLRPAAGEPASFEEKWSADRAHLDEGHALISRLPGLHQSGEMMILAGSSTECTRAAVEYVTRPEYVSAFVRWMRSQPGGVPRWFQAVVRARFKSQTPIVIDRVAFHALREKGN